MFRDTALSALLIVGFSVVAAAEPATLPATAKKVAKDEFIAFIDGKSVEVVIYDLEKPVTALLTWNWKKKTITGLALVDGKDKIKVSSKWSFEGDQACSDSGSCHDIYVDGTSFYEVRPDGAVHAMSTIK
jgi:hypothetical protein